MEARRHQRVDSHELPADHPAHPGAVRQWTQSRLQRALHDPGQAVMKRLVAYARSQRSQGLTEFAIIAPVILLLTFGIIDFGRALYLYITLQQAANEGARVAVRASYFIDPNGASHNWPKNSDVLSAVQGHAVAAILGNPCPNGPIPNGGNPQGAPIVPPTNTGWVFITDPS